MRTHLLSTAVCLCLMSLPAASLSQAESRPEPRCGGVEVPERWGEVGVADVTCSPGNIWRYVDNYRDFSKALQNALDSAAVLQHQGKSGLATVWIPAGEYVLKRPVLVDSRHSGLTLRGEGYASHLRADDVWTGHRNQPLILVRDEVQAVDAFSIRSVRLDGNRAAYERSGASEWPQTLWVDDYRAVGATRLTIEDVWAHSSRAAGLKIAATSSVIRGVHAWDNQIHGVAIISHSSDPHRPSVALVSDVDAHDNGMLGLDITIGSTDPSGPCAEECYADVSVSNFRFDRNFGGFKIAVGGRVSLSNGLVANSTGGNSVYTVRPVGTLNLSNIISENNRAGIGFSVANAGSYQFANLTSAGDGSGLWVSDPGAVVSITGLTVTNPVNPNGYAINLRQGRTRILGFEVANASGSVAVRAAATGAQLSGGRIEVNNRDEGTQRAQWGMRIESEHASVRDVLIAAEDPALGGASGIHARLADGLAAGRLLLDNVRFQAQPDANRLSITGNATNGASHAVIDLNAD